MISIAYVSSAAVAFNETKLQNLVAQCQRNNERLGVTGILVYSDGNFMQVIEGGELVTDELFSCIKRDARHHDVTTVHRHPISTREFQGWSMAYNILPPRPLRTNRVPHAFLDQARQRPLPLPSGTSASLVCSFMQP